MRSLHVGSAMIDIITLIASENIERATFTNDGKAYLMLETGRKVGAESITSHVGGGACNTAVSLARLGWDTAVLAKLGNDLNAMAVREHLELNRVDTDHLLTNEERATGTAVMVASHDRNASIFVHRGANETLTESDLTEEAFSERDLVYVTSLSNESADVFPVIVAEARSSGAMVAANPGIRQLTSRTSDFLDALSNLDLLSLNRVEAEALVPALAARHRSRADAVLPPDAPPLLRRGLQFGGFEMGLVAFIRALQADGPRWILITDGTEGAYLGTPDKVLWRPSLPVVVAGTAGAGDAFSSTLAAGLAEGSEPGAAMLDAAANAAAVVSQVDTTSGLMNRAALNGSRISHADLALLQF